MSNLAYQPPKSVEFFCTLLITGNWGPIFIGFIFVLQKQSGWTAFRPKDAFQLGKAMAKPARVTLRVNTLKTTRLELTLGDGIVNEHVGYGGCYVVFCFRPYIIIYGIGLNMLLDMMLDCSIQTSSIYVKLYDMCCWNNVVVVAYKWYMMCASIFIHLPQH